MFCTENASFMVRYSSIFCFMSSGVVSSIPERPALNEIELPVAWTSAISMSAYTFTISFAHSSPSFGSMLPALMLTLIIFVIVGLVVVGKAMIESERSAYDFQGYSATAREYTSHDARERNFDSQSVFGLSTVAGICALYLLCYLFVFITLKAKKEIQVEFEAREKSLYNLSKETGRSEYELFHISAKHHVVPSDRIGQDYKRYLADQTMPFYARDFVRRNKTQIDPSLMKEKEEAKPNSWQDWAKVLVVFPGSVILWITMLLASL